MKILDIYEFDDTPLPRYSTILGKTIQDITRFDTNSINQKYQNRIDALSKAYSDQLKWCYDNAPNVVIAPYISHEDLMTNWILYFENEEDLTHYKLRFLE